MSTVESERPGPPRAAKIAIVAVTVLAVLAVAGAGTAWWLARSDVPAEAVAPTPSASVSPSASASPSAEPTPSATPVANALTDPTFRAGESPYPNGWFGGGEVGVTCGMPAAEFTAHASDEAALTITVTGTATETADGWTLPVAISSQDAVDLNREPRLAWFQDGRLVDLTTVDVDGPPFASLAGGGQTLSADTTGDHLWGCGDVTDVLDGGFGTEPELLTDRPAGTYDVVAVLLTGQGVVLSEPVPLTTTVSAVAPASLRKGFADDRLAFGAEVTCGMPVADLPESDARFTVDIVGSLSFESPHWKLRIHVASSGGAGEGDSVSAALLWVQDGAVVDLGSADTHFDQPSEWFSGGPTLSGGSHDDVAVGSAVDTCMPSADGTTFRSYRPAGDYQVIPLVRIGYGDDVPLVLGDPVPVTVGERGRP